MAVVYTVNQTCKISPMRLFHMTSKAKAEAILKDGFRDASKQYLSDQEWAGVWVSDAPFWQDEGMTLFAIEVPDDAISEFEWAEEGKTIREWLVPASLLNQYGPPVVTDDADGDEIIAYPDPEEGELLIEWANERPNVERLRTRNPDPGAFMGDFDIGEFLGDP